MPEPRVQLDIRLRPIRLAFLVREGDFDDLIWAVRANTSIWGGLFNTLVPFQPGGRLPQSSKNLLAGFDPDFLVFPDHGFPLELNPEVTTTLEAEVGVARQWRADRSDILDEDGRIGQYIGLSITHVLRKEFASKHQFVLSEPVTAVYPAEGADPFTVALCGLFPEGRWARVDEQYRRAFKPRLVSVTADDILPIIRNDWHTPLSATALHLGPAYRHPLIPTLFLMDRDSFTDIVTFWNLRALGHDILTVPMPFEAAAIAASQSYLFDRSRYGHSGVFAHGRALLGKEIRREQVDVLEKLLRTERGGWLQGPHDVVEVPNDTGWNDFALPTIGGGTQTALARWRNEQAEFDTLTPTFIEDAHLLENWHWANVIQLIGHTSDDSRLLLEGLNDPVPLLSGIPSAMSERHLRYSKPEGLVALGSRLQDTERWLIPNGRALLAHYFHERGHDTSISATGQVFAQLMSTLGGLAGIELIRRRPIIDLLNSMAHGLVEVEDGESGRRPRVVGRSVLATKFFTTLCEAFKDETDATNCLRGMLDAQLLALGLLLKCSACGQKSWHPLDGLADVVKCERCLSPIAFPATRPERGSEWAYRTRGVITIENYVQGSYTLMLTLRWFAKLLWYETAWAGGLLFPDLDRQEVDLCMLVKPAYAAAQLVLCECKSHGGLSPEQADKLRRLFRLFPDARMVFSTLSQTLTREQQEILAALERDIRLLVLTGNELFADRADLPSQAETDRQRDPLARWQQQNANKYLTI